MKKVFFLMTILAAILLYPSSLSAQKKQKSDKIPFYKTIPSSSFFTINAEYLGGYRPDQYFSAQVPAFGFKAGTMRNVGWFVSGMTNFDFKGAFVTCDESEINTSVTSSTYFDVLGGITLRYWKPMSFHLGLGYSYRSFNNETIYGQWAHTPKHTAQGPAATAGLMLHLGGFIISAELLCSYNLQGIKLPNYPVDETRFSIGAKAGIGLCVPYREYNLPFERQSTAMETLNGPVYYSQPAETAPVVKQEAVPEPQPIAEPTPTIKSTTPTVVTLPVSQLNPGGSITICGEVTAEGNEPVIERGICWGTTYYPSVTGNHTSDGSGIGYFTTVISGLQPGTLYYFRAYAGTQSGIRYGNTVSVTIPDAPKAPVAPTQPMQGSYTPPMPQPPMMPMRPEVPQQQIVPQQPVVPQQQAAPQQPEMPKQQQTEPEETTAPQEATVPQETTPQQQTTEPQETTSQQPTDNEENPETTND